jgi:hypothetical protein
MFAEKTDLHEIRFPSSCKLLQCRDLKFYSQRPNPLNSACTAAPRALIDRTFPYTYMTSAASKPFSPAAVFSSPAARDLTKKQQCTYLLMYLLSQVSYLGSNLEFPIFRGLNGILDSVELAGCSCSIGILSRNSILLPMEYMTGSLP